MKLSDHELFHRKLDSPDLLLQQLQQLSQQLLPLAGHLPPKHRAKAVKQLQKQSREVLKDAEALCKLVQQQQQLSGQDPLCPHTAADISMAVMGLDDDAIEDESAYDISSGLEGLNPAAEQQLRRVFAVTDTLTRQEVGCPVCAGCGVFMTCGSWQGGVSNRKVSRGAADVWIWDVFCSRAAAVAGV